MAMARALRLTVRVRSPVTQDGSLLAACRRLLSVSTTEGSGAGDTAVHSGDPPSDDYTDRPPRFSGAEEEATTRAGGRVVGKHHPVGKAKAAEAEAEERVPPFAPSGKKPPLAPGSEHSLAADPAAGASSFTQKRQLSSSSSSSRELEAATPGGSESAARKVREEDREYYRTHKPSPLAEVEFADTRKPITRATGGGGAADRYDADVPGRMVEDTVDDSLARAEALFREAKARGNPEWPHSRALAEMLARRERDGEGEGRCWRWQRTALLGQLN